jgi:hypothetical protein
MVDGFELPVTSNWQPIEYSMSTRNNVSGIIKVLSLPKFLMTTDQLKDVKARVAALRRYL